jgi:hypothetical protein
MKNWNMLEHLPSMVIGFSIGLGFGLSVSGDPFVLRISSPSGGLLELKREHILMPSLPPNVGKIESTQLT